MVSMDWFFYGCFDCFRRMDPFLLLIFTSLAMLAVAVSKTSEVETTDYVYIPYDPHAAVTGMLTTRKELVTEQKMPFTPSMIDFQQAVQYNMQEISKYHDTVSKVGVNSAGSFYPGDYRSQTALLYDERV
jgi:hypothetical protein